MKVFQRQKRIFCLKQEKTIRDEESVFSQKNHVVFKYDFHDYTFARLYSSLHIFS